MGLPCNCVEVALADLLDRMKKAFPSCQVNEIDILQHMPKCECINVVSVTFQQANGVGYDYHLCQEHINLILAIRKHHNEEGL